MRYSILFVLDDDGNPSASVKMNTSSGQVIIVFSSTEKLEAFQEAISREAAEWGGRIGALAFEASSMSEVISKLKSKTSEDIFGLGQATFLPDNDPLCDEILMSIIEDESG